MGLAEEKYMLLTTFRRDGRAVPTPVWLVALGDGNVGFWTTSGSGKAKRLAHTPRVTVQACDARGNVKPASAVLDGTARVVTGSELEEIRTKVKAKYGVQAKISAIVVPLLARLKGHKASYADVGIVVSVPASAA